MGWIVSCNVFYLVDSRVLISCNSNDHAHLSTLHKYMRDGPSQGPSASTGDLKENF
jgi:hypothetical protein